MKSYQILIISCVSIPNTACHQMTIQLPTSLYVCFCTTKGMQTKRNMCWNMPKMWKTFPTLSPITWRNIISFFLIILGPDFLDKTGYQMIV